MRTRVAVVGSGISGLTTAYLLSRKYDVTVFEAEPRTGGHSHTHTIDDPTGPVRVDTGFIVHNDRTYPLLRRLFDELDIPTRPTEMSMSISCRECGLEFAGGRGARGIFAQKRRLADRRFLTMLADVKRFQRAALALLATDESLTEPQTFGDFLSAHRFNSYFVNHYAVPVVACVWSSGHADALRYPARYLFQFLARHGFLAVSGSPQWLTVEGGSAMYVDAVVNRLSDVRVQTRITGVERTAAGVQLSDVTGTKHLADRVVIATHADEALHLLSDPTGDEKRLLGAFNYSTSRTVLHRDNSLLPSAAAARAAWNYHKSGCTHAADGVMVTYWMNKLQGLTTDRPLLVTLNGNDAADKASTEAVMQYTHPIYTPESVAAQAQLSTLRDDRTAFAGAYHGWGFHEDGCRSGVEVSREWGVQW